MTDKELLELAAKAAQLPECGWMGPAFMYVKDNRFTDWNPLDDDGDALRLAEKLRLHILQNDPIEEVLWVSAIVSKRGLHAAEEFKHDDQRAEAMRRAIVRAAAEIGKRM